MPTALLFKGWLATIAPLIYRKYLYSWSLLVVCLHSLYSWSLLVICLHSLTNAIVTHQLSVIFYLFFWTVSPNSTLTPSDSWAPGPATLYWWSRPPVKAPLTPPSSKPHFRWWPHRLVALCFLLPEWRCHFAATQTFLCSRLFISSDYPRPFRRPCVPADPRTPSLHHLSQASFCGLGPFIQPPFARLVRWVLTIPATLAFFFFF